jgi:hypothetical protein
MRCKVRQVIRPDGMGYPKRQNDKIAKLFVTAIPSADGSGDLLFPLSNI